MGCTLLCGFSDVVYSTDYPNFEDFWAQLTTRWDKLWVEVFSANAAGGAQQDMYDMIWLHVPQQQATAVTRAGLVASKGKDTSLPPPWPQPVSSQPKLYIAGWSVRCQMAAGGGVLLLQLAVKRRGCCSSMMHPCMSAQNTPAHQAC
jgi:hypothetical protein